MLTIAGGAETTGSSNDFECERSDVPACEFLKVGNRVRPTASFIDMPSRFPPFAGIGPF
jgi:hypothetical protein